MRTHHLPIYRYYALSGLHTRITYGQGYLRTLDSVIIPFTMINMHIQAHKAHAKYYSPICTLLDRIIALSIEWDLRIDMYIHLFIKR